jgi:hypothetical protein
VSKKFLFRYNNNSIYEEDFQRNITNVSTLNVEPVDKGKLSEREGRKAMGLSLTRGYDCQAAETGFCYLNLDIVL